MPGQTRFCSPYEARLAIREQLGFYNAATVAAIYEFGNDKLDLTSASAWAPPLKRCIQEHPSMAIVVKDKETEKPFYEFVQTLDLKNHIDILDEAIAAGCNSEVAAMEKALSAMVDRNFSSSPFPPWSIVVLPLPPRPETTTKKRCFVAFLSSHSITDGGAAFAFHKSLLAALREQITTPNGTQQTDNTHLIPIPNHPLPDPFDTPERLPVTPDYLKALTSAPTPDPGIWTGAPVTLNPTTGLLTRVRLLEIPAPLVHTALTASRRHNTKLTATFHQLLIRALSRAITDPAVTSFSSQTAIDLRGAAGASPLQWGVYVSGVAATDPRADEDSLAWTGGVTPQQWCAAAGLSGKLAAASGRLVDQPIGLLRFVPSQRGSMVGRLGGRRDGSFALSNMLAFDGGEGVVRIRSMVVGSSAAVTSAPLSFCLVSIKGGSLMVSVNWQPGALGIPEAEEDGFISEVFKSLEGDFKALSEECLGSVHI